MTAICAKYGLQGQSFATLPTLKTYHLLKQKGHEVITLDIRKELNLLATCPACRLQITVPMNGFTDPLLDCQAIPRFAILLSINGFVADENNTHAAKAAPFGTDIADNCYPLLRNHRGKIDYSLIQQTLPSSSLFTTLRAMSYLFQAQQIEQGQGLAPSHIASLSGMAELLLFYPSHAPLTLVINVLNQQGEKVHTRKIGYFPAPRSLPKASYRLERHIVGEINAPKDQYFRSRWQFDLQVANETLRMTQFAGLSYHALKMLLKQLLPLPHFFRVFAKNNGQRSENRYDEFPQYQAVFYEHVIDSVIDQSLPLLTLQDYFMPETYEPRRLAEVCQLWDEHDQHVAKQILRQPSLEALVDLVDEFIALRDSLYSMTLALPDELAGSSVEVIRLECALEDKEGQWLTLPITHSATIPDTFTVYANIMSAKARDLEEANLRGLRSK